jgi:hypothetical protein
MWVTTSQAVEALKPSSSLGLLNGFTHNLSHRLNGLNSLLTWGYGSFPQITSLVTTTTYNYMKTLVRFPLTNFLKAHLFKDKNLQSFTTERRLTK